MRRRALWIAVTAIGLAGAVAALRRARGRDLPGVVVPTREDETASPVPEAADPGWLTPHRRKRLVEFGAALAILLSAASAYAFWTAQGSGAAVAAGATLNPGGVSVPSTSNGANVVTWTSQGSLSPSSTDDDEITYVVQRRLGSGTFANVASGDCAGVQEYGTTSCVDTVTTTGTYSYRLVATFNSWDATSAASGNVSATVDTTNPTVSTINRVGTAVTTNASSVQWLVTFSESVTGVDASDFQLAGTATTGASITSVTGSGATRTVTVTTGSSNGTLGLNLVDDDSIVDTAATPNPLGGPGAGNGNKTGALFTMDKTPPTVSSLKATSSAATNAATTTFTLVMSESVTGVDASDFQPVTTGSLSGVSIASVGTGTTTYTITVNTGTGDGTIGLNLVDNDSIVDAATNKLGGTGTGNGNFTGTPVATIDRTAPTLTSLQFFDTDLNGKVNQVKATFSENLASSTLTTQWTLANTPSAGTLASVATATNVATLTLTEGSGAADTGPGSFTTALAANASGIRDAAGNQASFSATAVADKARPIVTALVDTNGATNGKLESGDTLTATFSEAIASGVTASPTLTLVRPSSGNATLAITSLFSATTLGSADYLTAAGTVTFAGSAATGAGNTLKVTAGSCTSSASLCNTVGTGTGVAFTFTPLTTLLDAAGNTAGGSKALGTPVF